MLGRDSTSTGSTSDRQPCPAPPTGSQSSFSAKIACASGPITKIGTAMPTTPTVPAR